MTCKPLENEFVAFNITPYLFHEYLLQEKPFRAAMSQIDWSKFQGQEVVIYCSNDAIVPYWAYVLIAALLQPYAGFCGFGEQQQDHQQLVWTARVNHIDYSAFKDKRVVLKARSDVPVALYVAATSKLMEQVQSLMWGEAGAPVMIYKKKKSVPANTTKL